MKLLAIPIVFVGTISMVYHYWHPFASFVLGGVLAILILTGCILGSKSLFTFIGFLIPAGFCVFITSITLYNQLTIGNSWIPNLAFAFPAIALTAACVISLQLRNAVKKGIQKQILWWFPGAFFALGVIQEQVIGIIPYNASWIPMYRLISGLLAVVMLLCVFWLLWKDSQYLMSAATPVVVSAPAPRQNAAAAPQPMRQNVSAPAAPQYAPAQREPTPQTEGVTCPQCGAHIPTAGRKSGMVFCTVCGTSVNLGGPTEGVVDDALAEQIATLKRMRDGDLITQEEFEAKKRQLLGL